MSCAERCSVSEMGVSSEMERGVPHPRLRSFIPEYTGYRTSGLPPGVHVGLPSQWLRLIVAFDAGVDVTAPTGERDTYWAMLAGLHARPAIVRHDGSTHGILIPLTPAGASALFSTPASQLASVIAPLDAVLPGGAAELVDRLASAASWMARWAVLDDLLLRQLHTDVESDLLMGHAWCSIVGSHGSIPIGDIASEVGLNRQHFSRRFTQKYGLSPKVMSRVVRFERAHRMIRLPTLPSLANVAAACGYADQAHMTRDFNEFTGSSPTVWMRDELLPSVQDDRSPSRPRSIR